MQSDRGSVASSCATTVTLDEKSLSLLEKKILGFVNKSASKRCSNDKAAVGNISAGKKSPKVSPSMSTSNDHFQRFHPDFESEFVFLPYLNELYIKLMKLVYSPIVKDNFPFRYSFYNPLPSPLHEVPEEGTGKNEANATASLNERLSQSSSVSVGSNLESFPLLPEITADNFYAVLPKTHSEVLHLSQLLNHVLTEQEKDDPSDLSAELLEAAQKGLPMALFWLALSFRHSWTGISISPMRSFSCLVMAAYLSTLSLYKELGHEQPNSPMSPPTVHRRTRSTSTESVSTASLKRNTSTNPSDSAKVSTCSDGKSKTLPLRKDGNLKYWDLALSSKEKLLSSKTINSLYDPVDLATFLCEIGHVFEFNIDLPAATNATLPEVTSLEDINEAVYYYELAAALGDLDAARQLADLYSNAVTGLKKDKLKAAAYYRYLERHGKKLVNSTWIYKKKYGGPNP